MKAIVYVKGQVEGGEDMGVSARVAACLVAARKAGDLVVGVFTEEPGSGEELDGRPGLELALRALGATDGGKIYTLRDGRRDADRVCLDRMRQSVEAAGGSLVLADGFLVGEEGVEEKLAVLAREADAARGERTSVARKRIAQSGRTCCASAPYGYHIPTRRDVMLGKYPPHQLGKH